MKVQTLRVDYEKKSRTDRTPGNNLRHHHTNTLQIVETFGRQNFNYETECARRMQIPDIMYYDAGTYTQPTVDLICNLMQNSRSSKVTGKGIMQILVSASAGRRVIHIKRPRQDRVVGWMGRGRPLLRHQN